VFLPAVRPPIPLGAARKSFRMVPHGQLYEGGMFGSSALDLGSTRSGSSADRLSWMLPPASVAETRRERHLRQGLAGESRWVISKVALWQFERHRPQTCPAIARPTTRVRMMVAPAPADAWAKRLMLGQSNKKI